MPGHAVKKANSFIESIIFGYIGIVAAFILLILFIVALIIEKAFSTLLVILPIPLIIIILMVSKKSLNETKEEELTCPRCKGEGKLIQKSP